MPAPDSSFTFLHLTFITHILHHNTTFTHPHTLIHIHSFLTYSYIYAEMLQKYKIDQTLASIISKVKSKQPKCANGRN